MFYALAIVCDDFFVPSLEKICEVRGRDSGSLGEASEGTGGDRGHMACQCQAEDSWGALWWRRQSGQALSVATPNPHSETPRSELVGGVLSQTWQEKLVHRRLSGQLSRNC